MFIVAGVWGKTKTVYVYATHSYPNCGWLANKGMRSPPGWYEFGDNFLIEVIDLLETREGDPCRASKT